MQCLGNADFCLIYELQVFDWQPCRGIRFYVPRFFSFLAASFDVCSNIFEVAFILNVNDIQYSFIASISGLSVLAINFETIISRCQTEDSIQLGNWKYDSILCSICLVWEQCCYQFLNPGSNRVYRLPFPFRKTNQEFFFSFFFFAVYV